MNDFNAPVLKPLDVAVALKLLLLEGRGFGGGKFNGQDGQVDVPDLTNDKLSEPAWSLRQVAKETHLSLGEIYNSLRRLEQSQLVSSYDRKIRRKALHEFLVYGVRYAYPALYGPPARGIPTAYAAPILKDNFILSGQETPVWPHFEGTVRGISFSPLYKAAPLAALEDAEFYDLLALTDALRGDTRVRERTAAGELLHARIFGHE